MSEVLNIVMICLVMMVLLFYARKFRNRQVQKAGMNIVNDLRSKGALDPASAVELPYVQRKLLRIGFRDDRPKVMKQMVQMGIVGVTETGMFYLNESQIPKPEEA